MILFYFVCPYEDMKARIQIPVHKHTRAQSTTNVSWFIQFEPFRLRLQSAQGGVVNIL